MSDFQPPPTWANPVLMDKDPKTNENKATFNPVWLKWFVDLTALLSNSGGGGGGPGTPGTIGGNVYILSTDQPMTADNVVVAKDFPGNPNISLVKGTNVPVDNLRFLWVDLETPAGLVDGFNTVYTLNHNPVPPESLQVFLSDGAGITRSYLQGIDFTLGGGNTITFGAAPVPAGAGLRAFYRRALP